jgi:hypothetical protein
MHALVKKNENAERYSQNSCQHRQKELQHLMIHGRLASAYSQVGARCTWKRLKGRSLKTQKFTFQSKKKKKKRKTREVNTQITYVTVFR